MVPLRGVEGMTPKPCPFLPLFPFTFTITPWALTLPAIAMSAKSEERVEDSCIADWLDRVIKSIEKYEIELKDGEVKAEERIKALPG